MPTPADIERARYFLENYGLPAKILTENLAAEFEAVRKERDEYWEARIKEIYAAEVK